eukprot:264113_1
MKTVEDDKIICDGSSSAKLDQPLSAYDPYSPFIYFWKIQPIHPNRDIYHKSTASGLSNLQWFIGVVPEQTDNFQDTALFGLHHPFGISYGDRCVYLGKKK